MQGNGTSVGWGDDVMVAPVCEVTGARVRSAVLALWSGREGLWHRPTAGQVRQMAALGGAEPLSYRLDPAVNYLPAEVPVPDGGCEGTPGLAFTYRDGAGELHELVALPCGRGFELF